MARKNKKRARRSTAAIPKTAGSSKFAEREFDPDYSHVVNDLRRIGILAGSFFAVLIILSFILG